MLELKPASARTQGIAKWLGVQLPEGVNDALARQLIYNAALPMKLTLLAKRIGLDVTGLTYGSAWPLIKKERAKLEADILASDGLATDLFIEWEGFYWLITSITPAEGQVRAKITLRKLARPQLHRARRGKVQRTEGLIVPLEGVRTVYPLDIFNSTVRKAEELVFV